MVNVDRIIFFMNKVLYKPNKLKKAIIPKRTKIDKNNEIDDNIIPIIDSV
tara:strand:+ start:1363 stop:1512 length:150 start_codon:yes stop_codon:yes gene_type:complete